ncbi:MAG: alkaline phosphatase family protein [Pseudomonadota bacterium]
MAEVRNILFIMADQLRWDYLSCYGHPHLQTPNIDRLAERGVRFTRAYVQSPICGPSRMSFYTGRYVQSHGSTWNEVPLQIGEMTLGDYLRPLGRRTVLAGKTHMAADREGMARLGVDPNSIIGVLTSECGFEPFERDDGLHPDSNYAPSPAYNDYLRDKGYDGVNPWNWWANGVEGDDGEPHLGWFLKYSDRPARVAEQDSETPYMTRRAMRFMEEAGDEPWCLHLSYIKPHWPYIVPAPYHDMYGKDQIVPPIRSQAELEDPHPVYAAFTHHRFSQAFSKDEVRETVIPAYMGLIKQIDDQLGLLFDFMDQRGLMDQTMIVFTSDHGDYLGDHWLGEKELFHDPSVKIPLIISDPRTDADATRGSACEELVESIDLVPTFVEAVGGKVQPHRMEGLSLQPLLHGQPVPAWRKAAISEYDYSWRQARRELSVTVEDARMVMAVTERWKYILVEGFRPMLFDLEADPKELDDRGADPSLASVRAELHETIFAWARRHHQRTTVSRERIEAAFGREIDRGILIGYWEEADLDAGTENADDVTPINQN